MQKKISQLREKLAEISDLDKANGVLGWDRQTNMPRGGAETRSTIQATIGKISHQHSTSAELGNLLDDLISKVEQLEPDSDDARLIIHAHESFQKANKLPADFVVEQTKTLGAANQAWAIARQESSYAQFQPHLEKIIDLLHRYADYFQPYDHIYDVLLDKYEPGLTTEDIQNIFGAIKDRHVSLIEEIANKPEIDASMLHQYFPIEKQLEFGKNIISQFGYDFDRGRQDPVHHPFATNLGYGDQRITYRADENFLNPYLFAIMHESGHAMYEQGIPISLHRTPLYRGTSSGIHESQSRLWENLVGRSKPFWQYYFPKLKESFPTQFADVNVNDFYRAINKVSPSFIRVEADEATYNLHIMLRMELEIDILDGNIPLAEIPDAWNSKFQNILGITPPDDAQGVLQDVHWSWGLYGHFITYALGNLISAQIWEVCEEQNPSLNKQISQGEFSPLLSWLQENIYQHGRKYKSKELIKRITGDKINGEAYIRYLRNKFTGIYNL